MSSKIAKIKVAPDAAAFAQRGLNLDKLSAKEKRALDEVGALAGSKKGVIDGEEARAAFTFADANHDGFVDKKELKAFKKVLAQPIEKPDPVARGADAIKDQLPAALSRVEDAGQAVKTVLHVGEQIEALVAKKLEDPNADIQAIETEIQNYTQLLDATLQTWEKAALEVVKLLDNPDVRAALQKLPPDQAAETVSRALGSIAGTQTGREYIQQHVLPALERPAVDPFLNGLFAPAQMQAQGASPPDAAGQVDRGVKLLRAVAPAIAAAPNPDAVFDKALRGVLNLRREGDTGALREAGQQALFGKLAEAIKTLDLAGLGKVPIKIDEHFDDLGGVGGQIAARAFVDNSAVRKDLFSGRPANEVIAERGPQAAEASGEWGRFAWAAGIAAGVMAGVVAGVAIGAGSAVDGLWRNQKQAQPPEMKPADFGLQLR